MSIIDRQANLISHLAAELGVASQVLRALLRVESAGEGLVGGNPVVRLEVHHLWSACSPTERVAVDARFRVRGPRAWEGHEWRAAADGPWSPLHCSGLAGQASEWSAVQVARAIDERAAIESTSWGAGQVLGTWWRQIGYASPSLFAFAMADEGAQLRAVVGVVRAMGLEGPLRSRAWAVVARTYNGPGQVDWYAARLAEAYARG